MSRPPEATPRDDQVGRQLAGGGDHGQATTTAPLSTRRQGRGPCLSGRPPRVPPASSTTRTTVWRAISPEEVAGGDPDVTASGGTDGDGDLGQVGGHRKQHGPAERGVEVQADGQDVGWSARATPVTQIAAAAAAKTSSSHGRA